jgi:sec-independent protein translocase protein TatC
MERDQTLIEHLHDLKKMVVRIVFIVLAGFFACIYFSEYIFDFMRAPVLPFLNGHGLIFLAPIDKFMAHMKVSFLAGVILTCPIWLYQIWLFVAPGLYKQEKVYSVYFIVFGTILFLMGVAFVYWLIFPMAFKYLFGFGGNVDVPMISISEYVQFFITTTLLFGLAFEMPLILVILGMLGIIDATFLKQKRRVALFLISVLSAVVTPADAVSMIAMLIPMYILYEISIILVGILHKRRSELDVA